MTELPVLLPLQQELLDRLVSPGEPRPIADMNLRPTLLRTIDDALADLDVPASWTATNPFWLSKNALSSLHACEENYTATHGEPFTWNTANAKGTLTHNAVRLYCGGHTGDVNRLLRDALDAMRESPGTAEFADFLESLDEGGRADLISRALPAMETFTSSWPPLKRTIPIPDYAMKALFVDRRVAVSGKVDLAFGQPRATAEGVKVGRVLVELKTGGEYVAEHRQDAFLYALLDTLKTRVPPFRVATWYLDSATLVTEQVDEDVLRLAARRLADGIRKACELSVASYEPKRRAGWRCHFCPVSSDCPAAAAHDQARRAASESF